MYIIIEKKITVFVVFSVLVGLEKKLNSAAVLKLLKLLGGTDTD